MYMYTYMHDHACASHIHDSVLLLRGEGLADVDLPAINEKLIKSLKIIYLNKYKV